MSEKVKKILEEVSISNFASLDQATSELNEKGSFASLEQEQVKIRLEKLRTILIESLLTRAKKCKEDFEHFLFENEDRTEVTNNFLVSLTILENIKRNLKEVDKLYDKLVSNENKEKADS